MVDVIEDVKENVEEGGEVIEEIAEKGGEFAEKELEKAGKIGKKALKKVEEEIKVEGEKIGRISKKIVGGIEKGVKEDEEEIKELPREGEKVERKGKSILRKLEGGIEKFGDVIEGIEEDIEKDARKVKRAVREGVERVKEKVEKDEREGKSILRKIKESFEKAEELIEKDAGKIKRAVRKDERVLEDLSKKRIKVSIEGETRRSDAGLKGTRPDDAMLGEAESESSEEKTMELEEKKRLVLEKAKKLREKISAEEITSEELKEKVKLKKRTDMLVPLEEYVKAGIYLGTRVVTPNMRPFVYRRRADGLAIFNTDTIDEKLKEGIEFLAQFPPEEVVLVCKRQAGWRAAEKFSEITGIRAFTKKYPAGILTNRQLPDFFENELTIITDQWVDKNALNDTLMVRKKVLMICDTNNFSQGADSIIIGNNKSPKSIGIIFYILARGYCKARGISTERIPDLEWWTGELEETGMEKRKTTADSGAEFGV
ncbi:MAG: hypothetical protein U1B79_01805 [Candidatus Pacearchaeota archaeon]|nr:hypothetical protein [Candidatus Pacearchaeota archaeon]